MTETQTHEPAGSSASDPDAALAAPEQPRSLKHRVLGMRAVAAVAVASLILGGAGGLALGALSNGADEQQGPGFGGGPGGQFQQPLPGQGQLPGGGVQPGQGLAPGGLPPGSVPQDDVQPDAPAADDPSDTNT